MNMPPSNRRSWIARGLRAGALFATAIGIAGASFAQGRPIELVVPFSPGGSTDAMARLVAPKLAQQLGVTVTVVNKPGAGSLIGTQYALSATDGSRIMTGGNSNLGPVLAIPSQATYTLDDVAALGMATTNTLVLVSNPGRFANFDAFAKEAKAKPANGISIGSWGAKSPAHFYIALLGQQLKSDFLHVPFDGGAKAMLAVMGGQLDVAVVTVTTALANINAGKLTALAVTSGNRSADLPNVPSIKEVGVPEAEYVSFDGFAVSSKAPKERIEALRSAMRKVLTDPEFREGMKKIGAEPVALAGSEYDEFLKKNVRTLAAIAAKTPIKD